MQGRKGNWESGVSRVDRRCRDVTKRLVYDSLSDFASQMRMVWRLQPRLHKRVASRHFFGNLILVRNMFMWKLHTVLILEDLFLDIVRLFIRFRHIRTCSNMENDCVHTINRLLLHERALLLLPKPDYFLWVSRCKFLCTETDLISKRDGRLPIAFPMSPWEPMPWKFLLNAEVDQLEWEPFALTQSWQC